MKPFTRSLNLQAMEALLEAARLTSDRDALRKWARDNLPQPSTLARVSLYKDFIRRFLKGELRNSPLVQLYEATNDPQVRREALLVELLREEPLLDGLVYDVLYPTLLRPSDGLFAGEERELDLKAYDAYIENALKGKAASSIKASRTKTRSALVELGLLWRDGERHYLLAPNTPTLKGFVYAVVRELEDLGERKRARRFFFEEAKTPRRLLMRPETLEHLLSRAVDEHYLDQETFAGELYYRLAYPTALDLVKSWEKK